MTGSSFYDNHRRTQRLQEQTQQEEMERQLKRIMGNSSNTADNQDDPLKVMQQAYGPDTDREKNARELQQLQHSTSSLQRSRQEKQLQESIRISHQDNSEEFQRLVSQSEINEEPPTGFKLNWPQAEEEKSVWDDPDLVPVPVLPNFNDNSETYEVQSGSRPGTAYRRPGLPPSAYGNQQPYSCGTSIGPQDPTIQGLKNMIPELERTEEFSVQEFMKDKTNDDQQVRLSSKLSYQERVNQLEQQNKKQYFQTYRQSEPILDDLPRSEPSYCGQNQQSKSTIPTQIEFSQKNPLQEEDVPKSVQSRQDNEMAEIEDILRRAAQLSAVKEHTEHEVASKRQPAWNEPMSILSQKGDIRTSVASNSAKRQSIDPGAEFEEMKPVVSSIASQQMQFHADDVQPANAKPAGNTDQQILTDLDRIIANLEMQQKNMATFGVPTPTPQPEEHGEDGSPVDQQKQISYADQEDEDGDEVLQTGRSQWTSLSKKREERARRVGTPADADQDVQGKSANRKAPLDPRHQRPKSTKSIKSRGVSAKGSSGIDASPQRVGRYAMMALQQQNGGVELSNVSPSQKSTKSKGAFKTGGRGVDASPQRVGKYAMMALQKQTGTSIDNVSVSHKSNKSRGASQSRIEASPQHIGKYAMMALQSSPQITNINGPESPQPLGRFAQFALQQQSSTNEIKGEDIDNISKKYGRNPSRDRLEERSMLSQANDNRTNQSIISVNKAVASLHPGPIQQSPTGPILRPFSVKSNNSRYTASTKMMNRDTHNKFQALADQHGANQEFRQTTGQMTLGSMGVETVLDRRNTSKMAYYSDEEEDGLMESSKTNTAAGYKSTGRTYLPESRLTQMTVNNQINQFNIVEGDHND